MKQISRDLLVCWRKYYWKCEGDLLDQFLDLEKAKNLVGDLVIELKDFSE